MVISPALAQLFQSLSLAGVVTLLVNIIAPFLERTSFAAPTSSTHDATLRALNLALNVGLALGSAALLSQLGSGQDVLAVVGFGIAQATGSHLLYTSGKRPDPASASPASAAAPFDITSLVAPTAQAVSDAVNAAIAAHSS